MTKINKIPRKIDATDFIKNVFMPAVIGGGFLVPGFSTFTPSGKFSEDGESVTQRRQAIDIHMSQFKNEFLKHVKQGFSRWQYPRFRCLHLKRRMQSVDDCVDIFRIGLAHLPGPR